ncbi:MAG: hypothetical protein RR540_07130 [Oscillospiraceae bacterium]
MNLNSNSQNIDNLLKIVGGKIGVSPQELKSQLEQGKFDGAIKGMNANDAAKFQQAINNPGLIQQLMSAPQAQALYQKLMGNNNS